MAESVSVIRAGEIHTGPAVPAGQAAAS